MNNVPKELDDMKEEIQNYNDKEKYKLNLNQFYLIVWSVHQILKVTTQKLERLKTDE